MAKKKYYVLVILGIVVVSFVGTLAWLTWKSKETALVLTVGEVDGTRVTLKPYVINENLVPTLNYNSNDEVNIKVTNNNKLSSKVMVYYDIKQIDSELLIEDFKYTVLKSTDNGSNYFEYKSDNFIGAKTSDNFVIMEEVIPRNTEYKYKVYTWLDGSDTTSIDIQNKVFNSEIRVEIADMVPITANYLINSANPSTLMYNKATTTQKGEMWTFSHEATNQTEAIIDYRYIGSIPNNYITYNDEIWRIIGVFDGRIKIIRDEFIGEMPIDYKKNAVGSSTYDYGSNDWTDAQLMYMLNLTTYKLKTGYTLDGNYIRDNRGNIMYQMGCQPKSITAGDTSYDCTNNTWTLNSLALSWIDEVTYYLGGVSSHTDKGVDSWYNEERGTTVYSNRSKIWSGYISLMYPSDYGYTFANGVDDICYANTYNCRTAKSGTPSNSWLYKDGYNIWTITPNSNGPSTEYYINGSGYISSNNVNSQVVYINPVVYLKQNIKLDGTGTKSNPYIIIS